MQDSNVRACHLTLNSTVEQAWYHFRASAIPHDAPPIQLQEMRRAFYAGCSAMYNMVINVPNDQSDAWAANRLVEIGEELKEFGTDLLEGRK